MKNKNIIANIYRIQAYDSIMCGSYLLKVKVYLSIQIYFLLMNIKKDIIIITIFSIKSK